MSVPPTMSGANSGKPPLDHFPPPPPGGPPGQATAAPSQQPNAPTYNPANPTFAAPPSRAETDIYDFHEDPPVKPPRPEQANAPGTAPGAHEKSRWSSKFTSFGSKAAAPINALAHKLGSESFLPEKLDKECEKATRILRAFCKEGIETEPGAAPPTLDVPATGKPAEGRTSPGPAGQEKDSKGAKQRKNRTLLHIPSKVISRAVGLAIFTTARAGYMVSGATGSGVLIARLPDGRWSPPSGIQVHTVGAGFVMGVDIYDCVIVINTPEALEAFTRTRLSLGSDLAVVAGPWGAGGSIDFAAPESGPKAKGKGKEGDATAASSAPGLTQPKPTTAPTAAGGPAPTTFDQPPTSPTTAAGSKDRQPSPFRQMKPVFSYVKSRGLYAGVQIDGTSVTERKDENALFYGAKGIQVAQILKGDVPRAGPAATWERHVQPLLDMVRAAEGFRGSEQNAPLDPPTTLMGQMRFGADGSDAVPPPAPAGGPNTGAPPATWTAPPPPGVGSGAGTGTGAGPGVGSSAAPPGTTSFPPPPPQPNPNIGPAMMQWKAEEAARESAAASEATAPPPPTYSEFESGGPVPPPGSGPTAGQSSDLPPAYVDDGQVRPGAGDSKTGHH